MQEIDRKLVKEVLSQFKPKERTSLLEVVILAEEKEEIESWGLFCASLAWGGIEGKASSLRAFYSRISNSFNDFIENPRLEPLKEIYPNTPEKLQGLCIAINKIREDFGGISHLVSKKDNVESAIFFLAHELRKNIDNNSGLRTFNLPKVPPKPPENVGKISAMKRYCMYFRWMVRDEEPDFGIWNFFNKRNLLHPIDRHVARILYRWRVLPNPETSWTNVKKATQFFRKVEPEDPIKYDYHLVTFGQKYCQENEPNCKKCPIGEKYDCKA